MTERVALVTGGGTGIGLASARALAEDGFKVVITGRREGVLKEATATIDGGDYIAGDVSNGADIQRTVDQVKERYGRLDVLVNNAGVAPPGPIDQADEDHYDFVFGINVKGLIGMTRAALPLLRASKGNVINISSVVDTRPIPGFSVYSASKGAVTTFSKALAKELAPEGIRVNIVSPGPIETPLFDGLDVPEEEAQAMAEHIASMVPLARFGTAEEVAGAVRYLASPAASYVTGAEYTVDGGFAT